MFAEQGAVASSTLVARLKYNIKARGLGKCKVMPLNVCPIISLQTLPASTIDDVNYVLYANTTVLACQTFTLEGNQSLTIPAGLEMINDGIVNVTENAVINVYGTFTNNNEINV